MTIYNNHQQDIAKTNSRKSAQIDVEGLEMADETLC